MRWFAYIAACLAGLVLALLGDEPLLGLVVVAVVLYPLGTGLLIRADSTLDGPRRPALLPSLLAGLGGTFLDHETRRAVETPTAIEALIARLSETTDRDLSGLELALDEPTESVRQLEVWHETGSTREVAKDLVDRTSEL